MMQYKNLKKQEESKLKHTRWQEILQVGAKINEIRLCKTIQLLMNLRTSSLVR